MIFEWDEAKNRINVQKHGFDFAEAEEIFRGTFLVRPDLREDYGEKRWIGIGGFGGALPLWRSRNLKTIAFASSP